MKLQLPDKVYTVLKWIALICLPACSWFYSLIAGIWGLPYSEEISQTIAGVGTFIGILIGVSAYNYNKEG